jgi:hypothetical protein
MADLARLTLARRALWDAIDNWPALNVGGRSPILRKFKFEDEGDGNVEDVPSYEEMPAVSIWPQTVSIERNTNRQHLHNAPLTIHIWIPDWKLPRAEAMLEDIIDAVYRSGPDTVTAPLNTYIKNATGQNPWGDGSFTMNRARRQADSGPGTKHIKIEWTPTLKISVNPYPSA